MNPSTVVKPQPSITTPSLQPNYKWGLVHCLLPSSLYVGGDKNVRPICHDHKTRFDYTAECRVHKVH